MRVGKSDGSVLIMVVSGNYFKSLEEFKDSVECGEELELKLNGTEYYIGYFGENHVISEPFDVNTQVFQSFDELLDLNLHGTTLRESWMLLK